MYRTVSESTEADHILLVKVLDGDRPVSFQGAIKRWQNEQAFRSIFLTSLREAPFEAAGWETPALTSDNQDQPFQYALVNRPYLSSTADPKPFQAYFQSAGEGQDIIEFPNLGRDAHLIAPVPQSTLDTYAHLLSFVREGPRSQQHNLWKAVGHWLEMNISRKPLWLNTAGGGVDWLHVRVDTRPKYYQHSPYTQITPSEN